MVRISGEAIASGLALGSICIVRSEGGIPLVSGALLERAASVRRRGEADPLDIVLVVRTLAEAASIAIPGTQVVAVVAEELEPSTAPLPVPTVCGAAGIMKQAQDGGLVLVNGDRGLVLLDPDAAALMAMQAAQNLTLPRRRLLLDYAHQPARTLDGREVRIVAYAGDEYELAAAMVSGADALLATPESAGIFPRGEDWEHLDALRGLSDQMTGRTIALTSGVEAVSAEALLRASVQADILLTLPLGSSPDAFLEQQAHLRDQRDALLDANQLCGEVRLAGWLDPVNEPLASLGDYPVGRLMALAAHRRIVELDVLAWLNDLYMQAAPLMLPVEVQVEPSDSASVEAAIGLGAAGLIVPPSTVQAAKEIVRALNASLCREALLKGRLRA